MLKRVLPDFVKYAAKQQSALAAVSPTLEQYSEIPEMPPSEFQPKKYTGITYEKALETRKERLTPSLMTYYKKPLMIAEGHMQWLFDEQGRRYLDFFAGINTISVGHCHPRVVAALDKQMRTLWHTSNIYLHPGIHEYATKLTDKLPGDLKVAYIVNSGSEANDLAMLMARLYTGNYDIISLRSAYHGGSPYLQGLTAISTWNYNFPRGFGIHNTMNPDVFRGPYGGHKCRDTPNDSIRKCDCTQNECHASDMYIHQLEDLLSHSCPKKIAAFFAEPIQGAGGINQFPKDFLKGAYKAVRAKGGLCVADEVQTGFGRLGSEYWGFETHDVMPDIVTMAKGIGNGFPMAAVVTRKEIAMSLTEALHFNTFGGNPLACSVGSEVIDVIDDEKLQENCDIVGTYLMKKLAKLRDEYEILGDVRGKGLMIGLDFVNDKKSRSPLPAADVNDMMEDCKEMGLLLGKAGLHSNVLRIKPPMCITLSDADFAIDVIEKSIKNHYDRTKTQSYKMRQNVTVERVPMFTP